jgi:hypothetical protein
MSLADHGRNRSLSEAQRRNWAFYEAIKVNIWKLFIRVK